MYLSTLTFVLVMLPALLLVFYCIPGRAKPYFLLVSGAILCGWGMPFRLLFPAAYICFDFGVGLLLEKCRKHKQFCQFLLAFSFLLQVAALVAVRAVTGAGTENYLPIGLAFYTLQGLGYLIGIYRRKHAAEIRILDFALYLSFFPTLYAGPLMTYPEFCRQMEQRRCNVLNLGAGLSCFVHGLAEKVVLADALGYMFRELREADMAQMSMLTAWLTAITFTLYLYFEMHGYAQMAKGLGLCFGMRLPENFRQPFLAESITDFFNNWNITILTWFRSFFRPFLYRDQNRPLQRYGSLLITWVVIGSWYRSGIPLLLWGLIIGLLIMLEQLGLGAYLKRNYVIGLAYTTVILQFTWVLFFADSLREVGLYWRTMLGFGSSLADQYGIYFFTSYIALLLICMYIASGLFRDIVDRIGKTSVGKAISYIIPLFDAALLVLCLASMLYTETPQMLWLEL